MSEYLNIGFILGASLLGGSSTYLLATKMHMDVIKASCLLSIIFYICCLPFNQDTLATAFFGASFVGMSSTQVLRLRDIVLACIVFAGVFLVILPYIIDFGGALGTSAFISVIFVKSLLSLFSKQI